MIFLQFYRQQFYNNFTVQVRLAYWGNIAVNWQQNFPSELA